MLIWLCKKYSNLKFIQKMTTNVGGKSSKIGLKIRFRPKNREGKELRGENGAFDTEAARFPTAREVRSARKRPKSGKRPKNASSRGQRHNTLKIFWRVQNWLR